MKPNNFDHATPRPWLRDEAHHKSRCIMQSMPHGGTAAIVEFLPHTVTEEELLGNRELTLAAVNLFDAHRALADAAEALIREMNFTHSGKSVLNDARVALRGALARVREAEGGAL